MLQHCSENYSLSALLERREDASLRGLFKWHLCALSLLDSSQKRPLISKTATLGYATDMIPKAVSEPAS